MLLVPRSINSVKLVLPAVDLLHGSVGVEYARFV